MARSFADILAIVLEFTRTNSNDVKLVNFVTNAIDIAFYTVAREQRWPEFLVLRQSLVLTGTAGGGLIPLPDHMAVEEVKYTNHTPLRTWELSEKNRLVPPAPIYNKPRSYQIVTGLPETSTNYQMSLEPYSAIDEAQDSLLFSYYRVPGLFSTMSGPTLIRSVNWENMVIRLAEHNVLIYNGKIEAAQELWKEAMNSMQKQPQQANET